MVFLPTGRFVSAGRKGAELLLFARSLVRFVVGRSVFAHRVTQSENDMNFRVDISIFRGPLDLLLYLVRKHEINVVDISILKVTEQFIEFLDVLKEIDINAVGDFLDMASTLMEIKSRLILPHGDEQTEELDDPQDDLVQRLLEYKKYKDAASILDEQSRAWQQHYPRVANDVTQPSHDLADQPIQEVELWDLVSAFGRIIKESQVTPPTNIRYDGTPIHVYMERIHEQLLSERRAAFSQLFEPGMHKSAMIGVFLAILELVRHHSVRTEQNHTHGEIWIVPGQEFSESLSLANVDTYDSAPAGSQPESPAST